jgi:hypothetical protein
VHYKQCFENLGDINFYNICYDYICIAYTFGTPRVTTCAKMAPKHRAATRNTITQESESTTLDHRVMQHATPEADPGYKPEQEMAAAQAFNKIVEILQNLIERRAPRGEDVALERFLKFQPLTFFDEAKQFQQAEQWTEQKENIFQTLQYSEWQKVKFVTFRLKGLDRD